MERKKVIFGALIVLVLLIEACRAGDCGCPKAWQGQLLENSPQNMEHLL